MKQLFRNIIIISIVAILLLSVGLFGACENGCSPYDDRPAAPSNIRICELNHGNIFLWDSVEYTSYNRIYIRRSNDDSFIFIGTDEGCCCEAVYGFGGYFVWLLNPALGENTIKIISRVVTNFNNPDTCPSGYFVWNYVDSNPAYATLYIFYCNEYYANYGILTRKAIIL